MPKSSSLFFGLIISSFSLFPELAYAHHPHWHIEDDKVEELCPDSYRNLYTDFENTVSFLSEMINEFEEYDGTWSSINDTGTLSEATLVFGYLNASASGVELCLRLQGADNIPYEPDPDFPIEPTSSPSHNHFIQDTKRNAYNNLRLIHRRLNELRSNTP